MNTQIAVVIRRSPSL